MIKFIPLKKPFSLLIIGILGLAYCTATIAGGGGGASLDNKEGLERAADNFLIAFVLLSKTKDINLAPINGVEGNLEFQWKTRVLEYKYGSSLWHINILSTGYFIDIRRSQEISSEEYQNFRNDYILQKNLQREREEKAKEK